MKLIKPKTSKNIMDIKQPSVELSISHNNLSCKDVTDNLRKSKIMASITPNQSIVCGKNQCQIENGCRILFGTATKFEIKNIWHILKQEHKLECAHIKIPSIFSGCIYDYLQDSKCPGTFIHHKVKSKYQ